LWTQPDIGLGRTLYETEVGVKFHSLRRCDMAGLQS